MNIASRLLLLCRWKSDRLACRNGSALLVTLLVVSLLLVTVLAFVGMVRMEMRTVGLKQEQAQAQANARLGAELAVARLQELMGLDTRVSATADLFQGSPGGNLHQATLSSRAGMRFWTGAWDSGAYAERDASQKGFLGWLVSGNAGPIDAVAQDVDSSAMVPLVGAGSVQDAGQGVWVQTRPAGDSGTYAFWVGDEGVKARINLTDAHRESATREGRQQRLHSAQRHAAEMLTHDSAGARTLAADGLFSTENAKFNASLDRLSSVGQIPFLGADEASCEAYRSLRKRRFHDLSLASAGVLSNTRRGGLMRDLSLAFEMPLADFLAHDFFGAGSPLADPMPYWPGNASRRPPLVPVFRIEGQELRDALLGSFPENAPPEMRNPRRTEPPVVRGAPWQLFRNYYRLHLASDPDRAFYGFPTEIHRESGGVRVYNGQSMWPNAQMWALGRRYGQDVNAWTYSEDFGPAGANYSEAFPLGRPILPGIAPILVRLHIVFSVRTHPVPGSPGYYRADLYMDPIVTLFNPYDVPIRTGPGAAQSLDISLEMILVQFQIRLNGVDRQISFVDILRGASDFFGAPLYHPEYDEVFQMRLNVGSVLEMAPGEVVVFSGARGTPIEYRRTSGSARNSPSGVSIELQPGLSAYLPGESGIHLPDAFRLALDPLFQSEPAARAAQRGGVRELMGQRSLATPPVVSADRLNFRVISSDQRIRITSGSERYPVELGRLPFFDGLEGPMNNFTTPYVSEIEVDLPAIREEKRPFAVMDWQLKSGNHAYPFFQADHFNIRAAAFEQGRMAGFNTRMYQGSTREDALDIQGIATTSLNPVGTWLSYSGRNGFWGASHSSSGATHVPLFSLPRLPMQSLGAFQSLMLQQMGDDPGLIFGNARAPLFGERGQKIALQAMESDRFPGGKSPGATGRTPAFRLQRTLTRPDWSYLYNEALWDGFFFSTVTSPEAFQDFLAGIPPANGTLRPHAGRGAAARVDTLFDAASIRRQAPERAAAWMLREGTFNVNSTSVEAWRALLSSTRNLALDVADSAAPRAVVGTVFSRSLLPQNAENEVWRGFRSLSDSEIQLLAENIVREVRVRGPFLNLADFVNRRLVPAGHPSQRAGAVQAAIDAAPLNQSGFQRTLRTAGRAAASNYTLWMQSKIQEHLDHPLLANTPGYLTQGDVLTVIGPLLSTRSDTFTVRAFGEHNGARAWCELTVQRVPDYLDPSVAPWTPPGTAGAVNQRFGRRFVVTAFRWLKEDEV